MRPQLMIDPIMARVLKVMLYFSSDLISFHTLGDAWEDEPCALFFIGFILVIVCCPPCLVNSTCALGLDVSPTSLT